MKIIVISICLIFSGSLVYAHCGNCGSGEVKTEKHSCSKKKGKKCGKKCRKKHKDHKHTDGHKPESHSH